MHIGHASGLMTGLVHPCVAHDEAILVDRRSTPDGDNFVLDGSASNQQPRVCVVVL